MKTEIFLINFYLCLKSMDKYLKFLFITGVYKFSKVSIFSDLNHLEDITISKNSSLALCIVILYPVVKTVCYEFHIIFIPA